MRSEKTVPSLAESSVWPRIWIKGFPCLATKVTAHFILGGTLILTFFFSSGTLSTSETEEFRELLGEAQELFQRASNTENPDAARQLYQQARYRFERIIEEGQVRNSKLFYNIGNTYFRLGNIGRAILFYRRAELLNPTDANLRHNLRFVRSQRIDRLPSSQASEASRIFLFWHYLFSPKVKLYLFITAFSAACILGALAVLRIRRWKVVLLPIAGGIALLLLGSMLADEIRLRTIRDGVITVEEAVVRKGDGTAYQRSFLDPLHEGTEFRLLEERAGWYRIRLTDGRTGWIPALTAEMVMWDQNVQPF